MGGSSWCFWGVRVALCCETLKDLLAEVVSGPGRAWSIPAPQQAHRGVQPGMDNHELRVFS